MEPTTNVQSRAFEIADQSPLPRLTGLPDVSRVQYRPPVAVETVDFDTADRALSSHGILLRRTTGGPSPGWLVTLETAEGEMSATEELTKSDRKAAEGQDANPAQISVPGSLLDLIQAHLRGSQVLPVARQNILHAAVELIDSSGNVIAEIGDDQVAAMAVGTRTQGRVHHRREWTVALKAEFGPEKQADVFLDSVAKVLQEAGATSAPAPADVVDDRPAPIPDSQGEDDTTAVLRAALSSQVERLKAWDPLVRIDAYDSVHQMRVSARALRSIIQTYRPLFSEKEAKELNRELKTLGRILADARDSEVVRDMVDEKVAALPAGTVGTVVSPKIVKHLIRSFDDDYRKAHKRVRKELSGNWYFGLLDLLDGFIENLPLDPELTSKQKSDPASLLNPLVDDQLASVLAMARAVESEPDPIEQVELMHEVRKDAKRLRYAISAVSDSGLMEFDAATDSKMKVAKRLQGVLGEHRDSIMFGEHVLASARQEEKSGGNSFGYGVLFAAEFPLRAKAEKKFTKLVQRLGEE
ncbi:CYTH and CHAD domain-containing protein [Brevibacterium daeguense]|uniref:CYTH and CHAD domain-containing protein n=1 Tax=Brevibacterium daeguense TaxID=909936 RepID=A0ABP8EM79_9MICO